MNFSTALAPRVGLAQHPPAKKPKAFSGWPDVVDGVELPAWGCGNGFFFFLGKTAPKKRTYWGILGKTSPQDGEVDYSWYLVGGLEHGFYFPIQLGMSSSHLTNSIIFQRGWPTINQFLVKTWPQDGDVQQNMGQKPSVLWVKLDFFGVGYGDMDLARQIFFMFVWVDPPVLMAMKNPACSVDFPIKTGLMTLEGTIFRDPICLVVTGTWLLWLSIQLGIIIPSIPKWLLYIFQRGGSTTNQISFGQGPRLVEWLVSWLTQLFFESSMLTKPTG